MLDIGRYFCCCLYVACLIKFGLFASYRCEFSEYLRRPDHKQEFLLQWQQSYNALSAHLHREDSVKAELHHRVDVREPVAACFYMQSVWFHHCCTSDEQKF